VRLAKVDVQSMRRCGACSTSFVQVEAKCEMVPNSPSSRLFSTNAFGLIQIMPSVKMSLEEFYILAKKVHKFMKYAFEIPHLQGSLLEITILFGQSMDIISPLLLMSILPIRGQDSKYLFFIMILQTNHVFLLCVLC
jgi:hypothetical protein